MTSLPVLKTLGQFSLAVGECTAQPLPTHKARALVAFLVANRGRDISRERLLELFWNAFEPQRAREGLRTALSSVRQSLRSTDHDSEAILFTNKSVVRWIDSTDFDAERFVNLTESEDTAALESAVQLYQGDFLEGSYEEWAVTERDRIASAYENALAKMVARNKDPQTSRRLLERNPYHEGAYGTLIEAEVTNGRPTAASDLLKRYRAAMMQIGSEVSSAFEDRFSGVADLDPEDSELVVPFVGRTEELQRLARRFKEQLSTNEGFVALIVGEPGVGKTALLARAAEKAREEGLRTFTVPGRGDPGLGSWRSLYERLTGRDTNQLAGDSITTPHAAAHDIVEALGKPTVLIVDDAHLLTGDSFATFKQIVRFAQDAGHAVIATLRPEARERIEGALSGLRYDVTVLQSLSRADVGAAIALTIDSSTPEFIDALYGRSGGNPRFLFSLLQSLTQGEKLQRAGGRWRLAGKLGAERLEIPPNIRASVETCLHEAGDDAALAACALALEPSATARDLVTVLDFDEPRVLGALDQLTRYGVIREGDERAQFYFVHDLYREVAVSLLHPGRRVAIHHAFARQYEHSVASGAQLLRARHLRAAGQVLPSAETYLQAAQTACAHHAFQDAIESCAHGLDALKRVAPNRHISTLLSAFARVQCEAAINLGETALALEAAEEAVRQARAGEQAVEIANALNSRAAMHGALASGSAQLADALEAAEIATAAGDPRMRARALVQAAAAIGMSDAPGDSERLAQDACFLATEHGDFATLWAAYAQLLKIQIYEWRFDAATRTLAKAAPAAKRLGTSAQAELHCIQAAYHYLTGHLDAASVLLQSAVRCDPSPLTLFTVYYLQGVFARERGNRAQLFEAVAKCRDMQAVAKLPKCAAAVTMLEVDALLDRSDDGDADIASRSAHGLAATSGGLIGWSDCVELTRALVTVRLRIPNAHLALRSALDALEEHACRLPLDCDRAFARLAAASGEAGEFAIRDRAAERSAYYRAARAAAAMKVSASEISLSSRR